MTKGNSSKKKEKKGLSSSYIPPKMTKNQERDGKIWGQNNPSSENPRNSRSKYERDDAIPEYMNEED